MRLPIVPERALVRPRAISPETGQSLPLEDLVAEFLDHARGGAVQILGGCGSGKSTALRHLAAVLPQARHVAFVDDVPRDYVPNSAGPRFMVCTAADAADKPAARVLAVLSLGGWGDDECLEYLLARHPQCCGSVMSRLQRDPDPGLLNSLPELWCSVLDIMAADMTVKTAAVDPVDGGLPSDQPSDWPALEQVRGYAERVRQELERVDNVSELLLNTAIEHRLMHAETLAYMLHQLPIEKKIRQTQADVAERSQPRPESIEIAEGSVTLGLSRDAADFGWDNEYDAHTLSVPGFAVDRYKVTNGQFLEFLRAGGYGDPSLWTDADWEWKAANDVAHPAFWKRAGDHWHLRTMFDEIPLPLSWPVYASQAEASAYARWAGKRLPTEAEWQRAAYGPDGSRFPWGDETPGAEHGYFDFERWDPSPVDAFPRGRSAFGLDGLLANGWEWTATPFGPFEGFKAFPFYEGYSANFFDGKHFVMKGGSPRTDRSMLRRSFRNWFQPHYPYVYAGFRCAE